MKPSYPKLNLNVKKTRKQVFLEQMEQVDSWAALVERIAPYYAEGKTGRPLNKNNAVDALIDKIEKIKADIRALVEHTFRLIKLQFGFVKVRYYGLKKTLRKSSHCLRYRICG